MWRHPAVLLLAAALGQVELDCARPGQARQDVARLMLAEIEGAEDIHRAAMWEAFGRCPGGAAGEPCRQSERGRFDARWERERAAIEAKYRRVLSDFEQRCRGALSRSEAPSIL
jgi:hypothetical protein